MSNTAQIADRLQDMVRRYNRELALEALLKTILGVGFSFVVFGALFWFGWVIGFFIARSMHLEAWQFAALLSGLFLVVAAWSAWQRVDPLAGLEGFSDEQLMLTLISHASPGILYFSPRHATAGAALLLIGGPANLFEGLGVWRWRFRVDGSLIEEASRLLATCKADYPVEEVENPAAALLLRRLALIKVSPSGGSSILSLTDKGFAILSRSKMRAGKRSAAQREVDE
jgi:hypothetical protein